MSRIVWGLAVVVLLAGAILLVAGHVTADDRGPELIAVLLVGVPTAALTPFLQALAPALSRPGERHMLLWTLFALTGAPAKPLAL